MAGEICLRYSTSQTVKALIVSDNRSTVWNGSAFVAWSSLSLAQWRACLIACTEQLLSTGDRTGMYVADKPAGVNIDAGVLFFTGATPSPGDPIIGIQNLSEPPVNWDIQEIDEQGRVTTVAGAPGDITLTVTVQVGGVDLEAVACRLTVDSAGVTAVSGTGTEYTDANGEAEFLVAAGTYYLWRTKAGYSFPNPTQVTAA